MAHNDISHNRRCRSCKYCWSRSACGSIGDAICDYLELTGKIRSCPAGLECTVYEPREKKKGRAARRKTKRKGGKAR